MASSATENVLLLSTLGLLQIIKEAQQQHGLRHDNYQRYRSYCSRKLRRIRKSLHITNTYKQRNFQLKRFTAEHIASDSRYLLLSLFEAERCWAYAEQLKQEASTETRGRKLFQATNKLRRAVKHSQHLEDLCKNEESKVDAATKLEAQAYNLWLHGCLDIALKQYQTAVGHLTAAKTIYDKLSNASVVACPSLKESGNRKVSNEAVAHGDIYQERFQEIIAPQLRLCLGSLSEQVDLQSLIVGDESSVKGAVASTDVEKLIAQTREKQLEYSKFEIVWCKSVINVSKAPAKVKTFVTNIKSFTDQLSKAENFDAEVSLYEQFLVDCRDAIQAVRDENKDENFKFKRNVENDSASISNVTKPEYNNTNSEDLSEIQNLYLWLCNVRSTKTVEKYLLLIRHQQNCNVNNNSSTTTTTTNNSGSSRSNSKEKSTKNEDDLATAENNQEGRYLKSSKPQDLVRLYDAVLQNLNEILSLPGVSRDPSFVANTQCQIAYFTTFRCYYVAEVFFTQKKWREALALYDRCIGYSTKARKLASKCKEISDNIDLNLLSDLDKVLLSAKYMAHANCLVVDGSSSSQQLDNNSSAKTTNNEKLYVEDFTAYRRLNPQEIVGPKKSVHLARVPPDFRPMPCKPLFFDLALNQLTFPSLESKIDDGSAPGSGQKDSADKDKGGLGNIMKGWFWGGKN